MTKYKTYKYGPHSFKTYFKPVGHGYEIGMTCGNKSYFVGNFVHKKEAMKWWGTFNLEIKSFAKKYWAVNQMPFTWYCNFLSNHMYKCYYSFLDKLFSKYNHNFKKAVWKDVKKYNKMKKHFEPEYKMPFYEKAS